MPNFRYRAITQAGELVSGSISAPTAAEVGRRIEYLGLVPIDTVAEERRGAGSGFNLAFLSQPRAEDITVFTRDLALLLKAGARLDAALDLLATDIDIGRLRPIVAKIRSSVLGGESLADAVSHFEDAPMSGRSRCTPRTDGNIAVAASRQSLHDSAPWQLIHAVSGEH